MANKNNKNEYILLMHHNPLVKTLEDYMRSEHIYGISVDDFFKLNKDIIWQQLSISDKEKIKKENGKYPVSIDDINKNNTLPCPCKLKINSANVTAEIAINSTNSQENTSDFYSFAYDKIQEIYQDEGFVADNTNKRNIDCRVFGWFKSLYYIFSMGENRKNNEINKEYFSEFADLSRHIISLSTNVTENGGSFSFRLPIINTKKNVNELFKSKASDYSIYVGRGKKDEHSYNEGEEYYAKNSFSEIETNYYNWLISNNDLIFISFEKLEMETGRNSDLNEISDEDNFDVTSAISNGVYDMIGLVDNVSVITNSETAEAYVEVTGRDLMKLLIEDGSWFFNTSTTSDPSTVFANEHSYGKSGDIRSVDFQNGKYFTPPIGRLRRIGGEVDVFSNQLNMRISYILKGVLSQLSNIEVCPGFVFESWGEERTKYNDYYQGKQ